MIKIDAFLTHIGQVEKNQKPLEHLYLFSTDEPLLLMQAKDRLRKMVKEKGFTERETLMQDGQFDWSSLQSSNQNMSLFGEKKLIELTMPTGKPGREGAEVLKQFAKHILDQASQEPESITSIYLPKLDTQTQKSAWFSALENAGMAVRIDELDRTALPHWIKERLKSQNQQIESGEAGQRAIAFMVDQFEGNLIAAYQEIQKLGLLYPEGVLTEEQIRDAVLHVARYDVFHLSEAFLTGDMARINRMLDGLKGEGEALVLVVWTLSEEIRLIKSLKEGAMQGEHVPSILKARRIWGKREQLLPGVVQRMGMPMIDRALEMIANIDKQSKGMMAKEMPQDPWDGLRRIGGLFSWK
ncbi:DNA polymerase III subunit delta [Polynucleobacter sp. SHI8]|uniref:DNA polymerase III subunit delta n=1 Tax=unclassified Polynucleobacter TaxID=2640945 RepID=UPI00248FA49F|nr:MULTISPECIES: DNA polymerase III subunit delta [unclassified Polynucleobacter]BDW10172.1 DNA polymerase III subunit delta [Polynucleobacter sp. SHI2]BDW12618.1 DNA polymerase III subunit delta [Polynucleobacter sp. SHI8]